MQAGASLGVGIRSGRFRQKGSLVEEEFLFRSRQAGGEMADAGNLPESSRPSWAAGQRTPT